MIKKLLETSVGNWSETAFVHKNERVMSPNELMSIMKLQCSAYITNEDEGVVVYMSIKEYERLKKDRNYEVEE